ncbi:hypothetical protein ACFE04_011236 [Oxalis oulophora]
MKEVVQDSGKGNGESSVKLLEGYLAKLRKGESRMLKWHLWSTGMARLMKGDEIREPERITHAQVKVLRNALNEHGLDLRVKAAKEVVAACQQRISAARTEFVLSRDELQTCDRDVLELKVLLILHSFGASQYLLYNLADCF